MENKDFCGIVFIGAGSSWAYDNSPEGAAKKAGRQCKRDWRGLFKFKRKQELKVCIYDMKNHNGWYADYEGVFDTDTHEKIPLLQVEKVQV